jgi:hypothetical protein
VGASRRVTGGWPPTSPRGYVLPKNDLRPHHEPPWEQRRLLTLKRDRITRSGGVNTWRAGGSGGCSPVRRAGRRNPPAERLTGRCGPTLTPMSRRGRAGPTSVSSSRALKGGSRVARRCQQHAHRHGPRRQDGQLVPRTRPERLIFHSNAGSLFTSMRYPERLDGIGARPRSGPWRTLRLQRSQCDSSPFAAVIDS